VEHETAADDGVKGVERGTEADGGGERGRWDGGGGSGCQGAASASVRAASAAVAKHSQVISFFGGRN
jgi:hypothetical protein